MNSNFLRLLTLSRHVFFGESVSSPERQNRNQDHFTHNRPVRPRALKLKSSEFSNLAEAVILSLRRAVGIAPYIAGIIEFALASMMFLMAGFALTGYLISERQVTDIPTLAMDLNTGILAVVAFIFGLAGSISAAEKWSLLLSVVGASLIACWGLLENWYTLTLMTELDDIQRGITFGTVAIFFSMLTIILVVASKERFKLRLL